MNKQERDAIFHHLGVWFPPYEESNLINAKTELEFQNTMLRRKIKNQNKLEKENKELKKNQKYIKRRLVKLLENATQEYYEDLTLKLEECIKKLNRGTK